MVIPTNIQRKDLPVVVQVAMVAVGVAALKHVLLHALNTHELYMQRCLDLAVLGAGSVAPNPLVGAVLVCNGRIIGEGYHQQYGQAHAEVNCINAVRAADRELLPQSVLYVSLEPCAHYGKTPPCADLIIEKKIPVVVVGCRDPFEAVNGKGIEKLQAAGIEVITAVLENSCVSLNKRFFTSHTLHRPYIILKWAQTANGMIGNRGNQRLLISNELSNRLVHKWRSEEAAILVGTNTALKDNPALTNRHWPGRRPVRLVLDMHLRLPASLQLFDEPVQTIVFNGLRHETKSNIVYYRCTSGKDLLIQICTALYQLNILSVLVEGGAQLLQSFINENMYDEARIITSNNLTATDGIPAPAGNMLLMNTIQIQSDTIRICQPA